MEIGATPDQEAQTSPQAGKGSTIASTSVNSGYPAPKPKAGAGKVIVKTFEIIGKYTYNILKLFFDFLLRMFEIIISGLKSITFAILGLSTAVLILLIAGGAFLHMTGVTESDMFRDTQISVLGKIQGLSEDDISNRQKAAKLKATKEEAAEAAE